MPNYEYRCKQCRQRFSVFYKSYGDYDRATPACPNCGSTNVATLITGVAVQGTAPDYGAMSAHDMLSVLESGDSQQVGEMFQQVGGGDPRLGTDYHEATQRLLKGESKESVESALTQKEKSEKQALKKALD